MSLTSEPECKESTFAGVGGTKIFTRSWQPEAKTRGVVVIVPGFNSHSGQYFRRQTWFLALISCSWLSLPQKCIARVK